MTSRPLACWGQVNPVGTYPRKYLRSCSKRGALSICGKSSTRPCSSAQCNNHDCCLAWLALSTLKVAAAISGLQLEARTHFYIHIGAYTVHTQSLWSGAGCCTPNLAATCSYAAPVRDSCKHARSSQVPMHTPAGGICFVILAQGNNSRKNCCLRQWLEKLLRTSGCVKATISFATTKTLLHRGGNIRHSAQSGRHCLQAIPDGMETLAALPELLNKWHTLA